VVNRYAYDPWGNLLPGSTETVAQPLRFGAREWDSESGLYYLRNRYYHPGLGRFISEDPIRLAGGINPYTYAGNDPVNRTDPFGLDYCDEKKSQMQFTPARPGELPGIVFKCKVSGGGTGATPHFGNPYARGGPGAPILPGGPTPPIQGGGGSGGRGASPNLYFFVGKIEQKTPNRCPAKIDRYEPDGHFVGWWHMERGLGWPFGSPPIMVQYSGYLTAPEIGVKKGKAYGIMNCYTGIAWFGHPTFSAGGIGP
jgi:RHS repeat-associated protein